MALPIDRTTKSTLDTNLVNGNTSDAPVVKASNDNVYNTIDELNAKVDTHASTATLPHPDGSVVTAKLANGAVTTAKILDGNVITSKIADANVTTAKVADANIITSKLATGAVTTDKLADLSVTTAKIALASVGVAQLSPGAQVNESVNNALITALTADTTQRGINVMSAPYNAKGDGLTDDTTAIQNAIGALPSSGGLLILPYGSNFKITGTINIPANVTIFGYGATITGGSFNSFNVMGLTPTSTSVSAFTGNSLTVGSATGFSVGQIVHLKGQYVSLYSEAVSIVGTTITIADYIDFTITGTLTLYTSTKMNVFIKGLKFTGCTGSNYDIEVSGFSNPCTHVVIDECIFDTTVGVNLTKVGHVTVKDSSFTNVGDASFCNDTSFCSFINNKYINFTHGIRCQYTYGALIEGNTLKNGKDTSYSIGIELSGSDGTNVTTKSSNNKLLYNTIINAQKGVAGSAIGGIHLNFNSFNNLVKGNTCNYNGIGIYLENQGSQNTIEGNICSYNGGYYGVGIQLDWDCHDNVIANNQCHYNKGSVAALESCGIEIRAGLASGHTDKRNIVISNTCNFNGRCGLYINGSYTRVIGNKCYGNGSGGASYAPTAELLVTDADNVKISENDFISTSGGAQYVVRLESCVSLGFTRNYIEANASAINALLAQGVSSNCRFEGNNVVSAASARGFYLNFSAGSSQVYVLENRINHNNNGLQAYEMDNVDKYRSERNVLTGTSTSSTLYQCTNPITVFV